LICKQVSDVEITVEQMEETTALGLEGAIDIASAAELKAALQMALEARNPVRVSLAANVDLDVTAIQLLWAAEREATASGVDFRLGGELPKPVCAALKEAGFERFPVPE
jgi:anti-anti-sigma regulatory factor